MHLKRLVCRGFKSFADRTELEFDSGLTGIVGPNGCGKSNVVDALKWVLGDQRARSLRGNEMTDVIFKGAQGRDAMAVAEVSVTLEDHAGGLGGRTEVTIGRRLNRDKESDYLVNGEPVRLKDVRDLLMDTGLGVGAYSVMEQGRIDALLSADAVARRAIFEEAAGISKFKVQKKEALRRLERTEQNLARVTDLLEDRSRRVRSLKVQAGKARRYRELRAQLRDLRTALAVREGAELRQQQAAVAAALAEAQAQAAALEEQRAAMAAQVGEVEAEIEQARLAYEEVQERLRGLTSQEEAARHRAETHGTRARELTAQAEQALERHEALRGQQQDKLASLEEGRARLVQLEEEIIELSKVMDERREVLRAQQEGLRAAVHEREGARNAVLECIHERTAQRNRAHGHEAQIKATDQRAARVAERVTAVAAELAEVDGTRAELQGVVDGLQARIAGVREAEAGLLQAMAAVDRDAADLARREADLRESLSEVTGRLRVLRDMESRLEGLDQGPRYLLQNRPEGLRGSLLDLLQVDLELGAALEAALGSFAQALVVDTRANADAMIADLAANGRGRALLLVEEEFGVELDDRPHPPLPDGAALLAERARCAPQARRLLNWLLRGVCLVDSLQHADARRPDLAFVTPQGALLCGPRIEGGTSGGTDAQRGLVVRRAQIAALETEAAGLQTSLSALEHDRGHIEGRAADLEQQGQTLAHELEQLRKDEQEARAGLARAVGRHHELERSAEALQLEGDDLRRQRLTALVALSEDLLRSMLIQRREKNAAAREAELAGLLAASQSAATQAQQAEQEVRLRQVEAGTDRDGLRRQLRVQEEALDDLQRACADLQQRAQEARSGAEESTAEAEACRGRAEELAEAAAAVVGDRDAAGARVEVARARLVEVRSQTQQIELERQRFAEAVTAQRLQRSECEHRFVRLEERLRDDVEIELRRVLGEVTGYGVETHELVGPLPGEAAAADGTFVLLLGPPVPPASLEAERALTPLWVHPDFDFDSAAKEANSLQAQIERLGSVNLDAVRELEEEEGSIVFLEKEVTDLKEARKALLETLAKLEEESKRLFEENFEAARQNFQVIFRKLFQGGRADMFLVQGEDALEAGIEIMAKPPGKELQSINLLSGGERSMTALAILFGVFKVKPSPFCILDEVDAALDDTNVERFLRVLKEFVGPTQFCVVTHHKRTMAACQVLYGITMQKRGVSSRIAVSLHEVDSLIQPGQAPEAQERGMPSATRRRIAGEEAVGFEANG
ncbi:MAG: chromosome segregation protein SMC [Planctomycetota bacterium]